MVSDGDFHVLPVWIKKKKMDLLRISYSKICIKKSFRSEPLLISFVISVNWNKNILTLHYYLMRSHNTAGIHDLHLKFHKRLINIITFVSTEWALNLEGSLCQLTWWRGTGVFVVDSRPSYYWYWWLWQEYLERISPNNCAIYLTEKFLSSWRGLFFWKC